MDAASMSQMAKFNSSGVLNSARVMDVKWVPSSRTSFLVVSSRSLDTLMLLENDLLERYFLASI